MLLLHLLLFPCCSGKFDTLVRLVIFYGFRKPCLRYRNNMPCGYCFYEKLAKIIVLVDNWASIYMHDVEFICNIWHIVLNITRWTERTGYPDAFIMMIWKLSIFLIIFHRSKWVKCYIILERSHTSGAVVTAQSVFYRYTNLPNRLPEENLTNLGRVQRGRSTNTQWQFGMKKIAENSGVTRWSVLLKASRRKLSFL